jgi:hypothetical protein
MPDSRRVLTTPLKSKNTRFPTEGRKAVTCYSEGRTRSLLPQGAQKPSTSHCTSLQESPISAVHELESQFLHGVAICYCAGAGRPVSHSAQRSRAPCCDCSIVRIQPAQSENSSPFTEGRKEVICTKARTLETLLWENSCNSKRKKCKTPSKGAQTIKTLTKTNSRYVNLYAEWNSKTTTLHQKPIPPLRI